MIETAELPKVEDLEAYFEITSHHEIDNKIFIEVKNIKRRMSEFKESLRPLQTQENMTIESAVWFWIYSIADIPDTFLLIYTGAYLWI